MGNCFPFLRLKQTKYQENLETPPSNLDNIQLNSDEFITGLSTSDSFWALSQENTISLFKDFSSTCFWSTSERIRKILLKHEKVWTAGKNLEIFDNSGKELGSMSGHERPINSFDIIDLKLISGSGDYTVRLWDIEKCQEVCKSWINWNVVTCVKWLDCNIAVQASEDLRLRVWDVRTGKLAENNSIVVGENFATCLDGSGFNLVSGHRGFSGNGCEVKWWDLRKFLMVHANKAHDMPVEAVKICDDSVVSCGKDGRVVKYQNAKVVDLFNHPNATPFSSMERFKDGLLVANNQPKVLYFLIDPLKQKF